MQKEEDYDKIQYRFKKNIFKFFKGFLVGFSFIVPGVCSALVSMILGVYSILLEIIEYFYKIKVIKKHLFFISGIVLGIITLILGMSFLFKENQNLLEIFFLGLAIGGFINLFKKVKPLKPVDFLIIIGGILLTIMPELLIHNSTKQNHLIMIIIGGFLSSLAFIMPGISGSLILLMLGIYPVIINSFSSLLLMSLDRSSVIIVLLFGISFVLGAVLFSKLINKIINKYEKSFLKFCLGLLIGTISIILWKVIKIDYNIFIKIIIVFIGVIFIKIFDR